MCSTDIVVAAPKSPGWFGFVLGHMASESCVRRLHRRGINGHANAAHKLDTSLAQYQCWMPPGEVAAAFSDEHPPEHRRHRLRDTTRRTRCAFCVMPRCHISCKRGTESLVNTGFHCRIWDTPSGPHDPMLERGTTVEVTGSPRAGGAYEITVEAQAPVRRLATTSRARLTTWLVDQRSQGNPLPLITSDAVERAERYRPLRIEDRAVRLLQYFAQSTSSVGSNIAIQLPPLNTLGLSLDLTPRPRSLNLWEALAWSESADPSELEFIMSYLARKEWIEWESADITSPSYATVSVEGYAQIEASRINERRNQAFVAMWFNDEMVGAFEQGIQPAIEDAGYSAMRIDRKEHVNKIDDEIIAEIRRSRFLVADFSQGEDGARRRSLLRGRIRTWPGHSRDLHLPPLGPREALVRHAPIQPHPVGVTRRAASPLKNRILAVIGEGTNTTPDAT